MESVSIAEVGSLDGKPEGGWMKKIVYSIGTDPSSKIDNVKLHLWRGEKSTIWKVATFSNHTVAEQFAKEFDFPLSDRVKKILTQAQVTGQGRTKGE